MKRVLIAVGLASILLLLASCSTTSVGRHLYYFNTGQDADVRVHGSLPLVSVQLSGRTLSWSESSGNFVTTYTFEFDNANDFANMVFDYLPLHDLGATVPDALRNGDVRLTNYLDYKAWIKNESYDWGVPVVDKEDTPNQMDPNILKCLNENVNADKYLVIDGDIIYNRQKRMFGLIPFRMIYEISMVVYDSDGEKIFSKEYQHLLKKFPGSIYEAQSYYDALEISVEAVKGDMIADLQSFGATPAKENIRSDKEAM